MPELPELTILSRQMAKEVTGKQISKVEAFQPKCLNIPLEGFINITEGKVIASVENRGKWLFVRLDPGYYLLINLGMGGDLLHFPPNSVLPEKYQFKLTFSDLSGFIIRFWWFGYIHLVSEKELAQHKLTAKLGISPLSEEFTMEYFKNLLRKRKGGIKNFLLDQKKIAGIGNAYIHDILFKARVHPNRRIPTLSDREMDDLYNSIIAILNRSIKLGGNAYEKNFYGQKGSLRDLLVGYREGKPWPVCCTLITKIKTGSTSSYICLKCQR